MNSVSSSFAAALAAARDAAADQHYPKGALYMVATPIGNLADVSLRALHLLALVDCIACEDTRHTQSLLRAWGVEPPRAGWLAVHRHNEAEGAQRVLERLAAGQRVAYLSDAGTPAISDPGARLVAAARDGGHPVVPLPGASSVVAALSVAGIVDDGGSFVFAGFLPARAGERASALETLEGESRAIVLLEAPHRIASLARDLERFGQRRLTVARELTKRFEQIETLAAGEFTAWLAADAQRSRGEFVLVLHPRPQPLASAAEARRSDHVLELLLAELPLRTAVRIAVEITGEKRNSLYQRAVTLRK